MTSNLSNVAVCHAELSHWEFWSRLDRHLDKAGFAGKVRDRMAYVLLEEGRPVGLLRYGLFWDSIPFCNMLYVDGHCQGKGYGRLLMEHWEREMKHRGCGLLMTSTQVDETAQHFYRHLGYQDAGGFVLNVPGFEQPMELIMVKGI